MNRDRVISLNAAIKQLAMAVDSLKEDERFPYFLIVGSGISAPEVPTSSEIIGHCIAKAGSKDAPTFDSHAKLYSYWFHKAYPHSIDRQRYLSEMVEKSKVTPANLFLAHLLAGTKLARLVITPNFDNLLARALDLFGIRYRICDHPYTASRIDPQSDGLQIVQVHGSYLYYDIVNLYEELAGRKDRPHDAPISMFELLGRSLWDRSAIVVGYSGWAEDVIMESLELRLRSPLGRNLFWVCHRIGEISSLPSWLRDHPNVYFVVSDSDLLSYTNSQGDQASRDYMTQLPSDERKEKTNPLDAAHVFRELLGMSPFDPPELIRSPIDYLYNRVRSAIQEDLGKYGEDYAFQEVLQRLDAARHYLEHSRVQDKELSALIKSNMRAASEEVISQVKTLELGRYDSDQLSQISNALQNAVDSTSVSIEERITGLTLLDSVKDQIYQHHPDTKHLRRFLKARIAIALKLYYIGAVDKEIAIYDDLTSRFGDETNDRIVAFVITATRYKANSLWMQYQKFDEAEAIYAKLIKDHEHDQSTSVQLAVGQCMDALADMLEASGRDSTSARKRVINEFKDKTNRKYRPLVADAYISLGRELFGLGRTEESLQAFLDAIAYCCAGLPRLSPSLASAYRNACAVYTHLDKYAEIIELGTEALAFLKTASGVSKSQLIGSRISIYRSRGIAFEGVGKQDLAIADYEAAVSEKADLLVSVDAREVANSYLRLLVLWQQRGEASKAENIREEAVSRLQHIEDESVRQAIAQMSKKDGGFNS